MYKNIITRSWLMISLILAISLKSSKCSTEYAVPKPCISLLPRGFRVSIPDEEGINLFAFHGNLNRRMISLEAGQYSKDILKKSGTNWIFEDTETVVTPGDVLYYWLFVIRNGLGYRYDDGVFTFQNIHHSANNCSRNAEPKILPPANSVSQSPISNWYFEPVDSKLLLPSTSSPTATATHQPSSIPSATSTSTGADIINSIPTCCQVLLNVSTHVVSLASQVDDIREENHILYKIAQKDDHYSRTLRIFGKYSTSLFPTPKYFVEKFLLEKLNLVDQVKVTEARIIPDNGVSFKVESLAEKVQIVRASNVKLKGSNYVLSW